MTTKTKERMALAFFLAFILNIMVFGFICEDLTFFAAIAVVLIYIIEIRDEIISQLTGSRKTEKQDLLFTIFFGFILLYLLLTAKAEILIPVACILLLLGHSKYYVLSQLDKTRIQSNSPK